MRELNVPTASTRLILIAVLTILFLFPLTLQASAAPELVITEGNPIELKKATEGEIRKGHFTLKNGGDEDLKIQNFIVTCSCLTILNRDLAPLKPGETKEVNFLFDTAHFGGKKTRKEVMIFSNCPKSPERLGILIRVENRSDYEFLAEGFEERLNILVDIREEKAYENGHIIGAINVPESGLKDFLQKIPDSVPVFIYSQSGNLSGKLAGKLSREQNKKIKSLIGGFEQWKLVHPDFLIARPASN